MNKRLRKKFKMKGEHKRHLHIKVYNTKKSIGKILVCGSGKQNLPTFNPYTTAHPIILSDTPKFLSSNGKGIDYE